MGDCSNKLAVPFEFCPPQETLEVVSAIQDEMLKTMTVATKRTLVILDIHVVHHIQPF